MKQILRLFYIQYIFAKYGVDEVITSFGLFSPIRFLIYFNPWNWTRPKGRNRGEALRLSLEALGPIFIKFGQALSTRPDILPPDIAKELKMLQDNVAPFPTDVALSILSKAYGMPIDALFETFDENVLASASMAQVHAATLKSGESVVVKILRPNMHQMIRRDLKLMHKIAKLAHKYWPLSARFKPSEIVQEFENSLLDEMNLQKEAANASQLRRNFEHSPLLYVPQVHWEYVRKNVLVLERIHGIPVTDIEQLNANHIDLKKLAERGVEIFFTQVFRDCFFHADMHPGNIFVSKENPKDPKYICVDFGIIGSLNDSDKRYLAENLLAFFNRDYRRVAQLHIESGWISRETRVQAFENEIRMVCEPLFERPLKDISFALIVMQLFQVARRFEMNVQPQLVLLQKTLLAIEGLGRQIYPELNLWTTAKPFLERWMRSQIGPKQFFNAIKQNLPFYMETLPQLPKLHYDMCMRQNQLYEALSLSGGHVLTRGRKKGYLFISIGVLILGALTLKYYPLSNINARMLLTGFGSGVTACLMTLFFIDKRRK